MDLGTVPTTSTMSRRPETVLPSLAAPQGSEAALLFSPPPVILSVGRTATAVEEPSLRIHFNLVILSERSESKDLRLTAAHDRYEAVIACLLSTFRPQRVL